MHSLSEVTTFEFKEALTPSSVRVFQVIALGLSGGVVIFSGVVAMMYLLQIHTNLQSDMVSSVQLMSGVNAVLVVLSMIVGKIISEKQFSVSNLQTAVTRVSLDQEGKPLNLTPAEKCLSAIRTAFLLRLAPMEGAAFFGIATTMQVVQSGIGSLQPWYYANALAIIPILSYVAVTFPTAERIEDIFQRKIQGRSI